LPLRLAVPRIQVAVAHRPNHDSNRITIRITVSRIIL
jgi:hypothetical protein